MSSPVNKNVIWHSHSVNRDDRIKIKGHKPCIVWFTGLSGSGKSTIANALEKRLNLMSIHTYLLDGDNIRHGLNRDLGFSEFDRHENIRRVGETAKLFTDAGLIVITAFISPFIKDRETARQLNNEAAFFEVFVNAPLDVCEARDPKNFYKMARNGEIKEFTGISSPYEPPCNPEIILNTDTVSVDESVEKIIAELKRNKII